MQCEAGSINTSSENWMRILLLTDSGGEFRFRKVGKKKKSLSITKGKCGSEELQHIIFSFHVTVRLNSLKRN